MTYEEKDWPKASLERWRPGVPEDTERLLVFDLSNGAVYTGAGFPIACSTQVSSPAPPVGEQSSMTFVGGTDGYLYQGFVEQSVSLGMPSRRTRFECAYNTVSNMLVVDSSAMGGIFPSDGMGGAVNPYLIGLPVLIRMADGSGSFMDVWRTILGGGEPNELYLNEDLVSAGFERAATTGDHFYIAPMYCGALFEEIRSSRPACLRSVEMNVHDGQMSSQDMTIMVYCPSDDDITVSLDGAPDVERVFTTDDLRRGRGVISVPGKPARSRIYGIGFRPSGGGLLQLENINVVEAVHPSEMEQ